MLIPKFTSLEISKITGIFKARLIVTDIFCYCESLSCAHTTCTFTAFGETGEERVHLTKLKSKMDVLDRYLALPAELQWMIYNMLPCCVQRVIDDERELTIEEDLLNCARRNHVGCVLHLVQTREFNRIYYCMYDKCLLNRVIEDRYFDLLLILVEHVVKRAEKGSHGFSYAFAAVELETIPEGSEKEVVMKCVTQIVEHDTDFKLCKRRRIN